MGLLTGWMQEQHFSPGPHKANRNNVERVKGKISSTFFQNKWEKNQRECTMWRAGKKDAKQLWHKLPVLQNSSTSTALDKQKNASMLYGQMSGHSIKPTDHYKNDGIESPTKAVLHLTAHTVQHRVQQFFSGLTLISTEGSD